MNMNWPTRLTIMLPVILLLSASLESEMVPLIQVDNKPTDRIDIVPIDDAHRSRIPPSLVGVAALPPGSFVLVNRTATPITAVVVRWTYSDSKGDLQQRQINCDAYVFAPLEPIVHAFDLSLITPYGCTRQELFPRLATGAVLGSPIVPSIVSPVSVDPHAAMHVYLDSVVFQDGQIWGPDKFQYYTEIQNRYSSVQEFIAEVMAGRGAGEGFPSLLARVRSDAKGKMDKASQLRAYYAGLLQRSPNPEGTLQQLKVQTPPPPFRHIGEL